MSANFTPSQSAIKDLKPFRFWCQKVLPTVYDDSLSYYELLTKVVNYLNDTIDNVEALNDNVQNIYDAYILLQNYVNEYFDQNFPQLVSDKLDEMAEDGTLTALIKAYIDPYFEEKSAEIEEAFDAQNERIGDAIESQNDTISEAISDQNDVLSAQTSSINQLTSRMDAFINQHSGLSGETLLYDGSGTPAYTEGSYLALSDALANYKYLRFVWKHRGEICVQDFEINASASPAQNYNLRDTISAPPVQSGGSASWEMCNIVVINATSGSTNQLELGGATVIDNFGYNDGPIDGNMNTGILKVIGIKNVSDTEVVDARVGADGITYATLEERLNAENNALKSAVFVTAYVNGRDLVWSQGTINDNGVAGNSDYFIRSNYYEKPTDGVIEYTGPLNNDNNILYSAFVFEYDSEKVYLRKQALIVQGQVTPCTIGENCYYVRYRFGHASATGETTVPSEGAKFEIAYEKSRFSEADEIIAEYEERIEELDNKIDYPSGDNPKYGTANQILSTLGNGNTKWVDQQLPSVEAMTSAINAWLSENPQATTTESNRAYDNVYDMTVDSGITVGMICKTLGFHASGDGGGAYYKVTNSGTPNGMNVISLQNGLFANLIVDNIVNVKQIGAYGDDIHDDSNVLLHAVSLLSDNRTLYFPTGTYLHGDGVTGSSGTGNSYTPTGSGNTYYHDSNHPVDIGRDIRLIIQGFNNISIIGDGKGSVIKSNPNNGECRNNEIFSIIMCNNLVIRNIKIDGNRQARGLWLADSDYGGYNQRGNLRIIGCNNVIIDNVASINSGMDGLYIGVSYVDSVKTKSQNCYISNSDFSNAHRNGISVGGCNYVYINRCVADKAGTSGESWGGTAPKACVDIEADYGQNYPNDQIFIDGLRALEAAGTYSLWVARCAHNVYIEKTTVDKSVYTSPTDTLNINVSTIVLS